MPRGESEMTGDGRHEGYVTNVSIWFAVGTDLFARSNVERCIEVLGVGFWLVFQKLLGPGSRCVALFNRLTRLGCAKIPDFRSA